MSGWKPSTSFTGSDRADHLRLVDLRRQRQLDEDAVDRVVGVQARDELEHLLLDGRRGQPVVVGVDAGLDRSLVLGVM